MEQDQKIEKNGKHKFDTHNGKKQKGVADKFIAELPLSA